MSVEGWECLGGARLRTSCLHTWRMLRNAIYGGWVVVTTSSSSYKLVVCVWGHQEMEPVDVKCMQKKFQTRFNHATPLNGCSLVLYSVGGYSD